MLPRERLLAALDRRAVDRVPKALSFYPVSFDGMSDDQIGERLAIDIRFVEFQPSKELAAFEEYLDSLPRDVDIGTPSILRTYSEWRYRPDISGPGILGDLEGEHHVGGGDLPELNSAYRREGLSERVAALKGRGYAVAGLPPHLGGEMFESAWRLRGFNTFMLDLALRKPIAGYLLDQLMAMARENCRVLALAGVDVVVLDDDVGMPSTMIISPDTWREFLKPRLSSVIGAAREVSPDIRVLYHSDGYIEPIIPDLVEIGVTALNPVQPDRMDPSRIKRLYGEHLAIWGAIGAQGLLSRGTAGEVRDEVKRRIETLGCRGYVACPAYDVDYDVPWANLAAFAEAVDTYGGC